MTTYRNLEDTAGVTSFTNPTKGGASDFPLRPGPVAEAALATVDDAVLVRAQNVHDYFIANQGLHNWEDLKSFFAVRPPFPRMVITYDHPFVNKISRMRTVRHVDLVIAQRDHEYFSHYFKKEALAPIEQLLELEVLVAAAQPFLFVEMKMAIDAQTVPGRWFVMINEAGAVVTSGDLGWVFVKDPEEDAWLKRATDASGEDMQEVVKDYYALNGATALATLQFMNCKNVEIVDNPPSRQQRRHAERDGKRPPLTYKTLVIHPTGKKRFMNVGGNPQIHAGDARALHICRGHFKDYRSGTGLGKFHVRGVWWWSPQVRGTVERGRVVKDYEVKEA